MRAREIPTLPVRRAPAAIAIASLALLLSACAVGSYQLEPPSAEIKFEDGCPKDVMPVGASGLTCPDPGDEDALCARPAQKVIWQSVDEDGNWTEDEFDIYFSPFPSRVIPGRNGRAAATVLDRPKPPKGEYKYTVVGRDCPDDPLDPRIIVQY